VWREKGLKKITTLYGHGERILGLGILDEGETVVSGSSDESLRFWKVSGSKSQT
jgi:WD40 repeat protein